MIRIANGTAKVQVSGTIELTTITTLDRSALYVLKIGDAIMFVPIDNLLAQSFFPTGSINERTIIQARIRATRRVTINANGYTSGKTWELYKIPFTIG